MRTLAEGGGGMPDFFVVGHAKCGTTALYEGLKPHPEIFLPELKEPYFFIPEVRREERWTLFDAPRSLEQYLALFAPATPGQRVGEVSPHYIWSDTAAAGIAAARPDARIVAILREPASFLHSLHTHLLKSHIETEKSLRRALELEAPRRAGREIPRSSRWPRLLLYSEHVRYAAQLRRFYNHFPPEQILVLVYEDFRRDNQATLETVLRFLGVDSERPPAVPESNATRRQVRRPGLYSALHRLSMGEGATAHTLRGAIKAVTPRGLRRRGLESARHRLAMGEPEAPDPVLAAELRRRFKPEVVAVGELLERDLVAKWGYESVD
jgi:Sulfotransferase family